LSKSCQKVVKKLSKSCQTVVKQLSKSCQKVVTKSCHHRTLKPQTRKTGKFERRSDQEWMMKKEEATMKKLGIRRLVATSSHLVKRFFLVAFGVVNV
jgi:hypothetical protein